MTLTDYKKEITEIFRRHTYRGFADWRQCGNLEYYLSDFLYRCSRELLAEGREKDLFDVTCRAYIKWGATDKDDSNGETQCFVGTVFEIWDSIYEREPASLPHDKMFAWLMGKQDGSLIDYMEDFLLEYVMDHFKEPHLLEKKLAYLDQKIEDLKEQAKEDRWRLSSIDRYHQMALRIYSEQSRPIEFIREYAREMKTITSREQLADIELKYGNTDEAIAIYEELAAGELKRPWFRSEYNLKLKDIYKEHGMQARYEEQIRRLLYLETGSREILTEYKAIIPPEDWEKARDELFDSFGAENYRVLPWYAMEGCYDRLMDGVEACGYPYLKTYVKLLEDKYPERCLGILVKTAEKDAAEANKRSDYQHVARVLRWMKKYPGGEEKAAELAAKFRAAYPRRRAMIDELQGI